VNGKYSSKKPSNSNKNQEEDHKMKEVVLDCFGEACPVPLVKAEKAMVDLEIGDLLIVQIDHSCAMKNVPEWARAQGYNVEIEEIEDGEWEVFIEKTK
jgi:TusA-related sulfurtransferase